MQLVRPGRTCPIFYLFRVCSARMQTDTRMSPCKTENPRAEKMLAGSLSGRACGKRTLPYADVDPAGLSMDPARSCGLGQKRVPYILRIS